MGSLPLEGFTVGITADRRADEQADMLVRRGARVVHGPAIRTFPLRSDEAVREATEDLVRRPPVVVLASTGIGARGWLALAESWGLAEALVDALAGAHLVARGPKAAGALASAGLAVHWQAPSERLDDAVGHLVRGGVAGARVAVQVDGAGSVGAVDALRAAGADVVELPVYRWTLPSDTAPALRLVRAACAGRLDAVTFTAAPAVRNLFDVARRAGLADELRAAFDGRVLAMCVGPVCREAAAACGVERAKEPSRARLGSMVRALTDELHGRRLVVRLGPWEIEACGSLVRVASQRVDLADRERRVFEALARRPGVVVAKESLLAGVWASRTVDEHVVEVTVGRLRRRLAPTPIVVEAVARRGYRLGLRTDGAG